MIDPTWDPTTLTAQEEAILLTLRSATHRVVSRNELARAAGLNSTQGRRVDVLLVRIRRTLDDESIVNIRNRGWRLVSGATEPECNDDVSDRRVSA